MRGAIAIVAVGGMTIAGVGAASAASPQWVVAADVLTTRATTGTSWFADKKNNGAFFDGSFSGRQALVLRDVLVTDGIRILNSYAPGTQQPTISEIASNGGFTYAGAPVNFQIEILYTPANPAVYGPGVAGTGCTPTLVAGTCYVTLKWQTIDPGVTWTTATLDPAIAYTGTTPGWLSTRQIGSAPITGASITTYLTQMNTTTSPPILLGVGVSIGSGTANETAYVETLNYAGAVYNFGVEPPTPPAPVLPATGVPIISLLTAGVLLSVTGFGLVALRRRRGKISEPA